MNRFRSHHWPFLTPSPCFFILEGLCSPMRQHVAENVRSRLKEERISFCTIQSFWSPCLNYLVSTVQCTVAEIRRAKSWRRKASRCSTSAPTSGTILLTAHWSIRLAEAELGPHCCEWSADSATIWHLFLAGKTLAKWWTQGPLKIQDL